MIAVAARRRSDLPMAAMCIAVFAWSFGPLVVRSSSVSSATFAFWRLWLAVPSMWAIAWRFGGRPSLDVFRRAAVPGLFFGASMMLGFLAYRTTSIADATLIPALTPALILVLARRLFGEQRSRRQIVLAVAAFAGVAVVVLGAGKNSGQSLKGDLFSAGNLFVWTAYLVLAKQIRNRNVHSWSLIATFFTIAAVVVTPYCLIASNDLLASKPRDYVLYAVMIVGPGTLGHGLMTWANKYVDLSISSVLSLANPVLSMVWAWMIYGERLGPEQLVGVCVVIGALALITLDPPPARAVSIEVTDGAVA